MNKRLIGVIALAAFLAACSSKKVKEEPAPAVEDKSPTTQSQPAAPATSALRPPRASRRTRTRPARAGRREATWGEAGLRVTAPSARPNCLPCAAHARREDRHLRRRAAGRLRPLAREGVRGRPRPRRRHDLTAYDASYLALAIELKMPLACGDGALKTALPRAGVRLA